jgi:hypothetical protein
MVYDRFSCAASVPSTSPSALNKRTLTASTRATFSPGLSSSRLLSVGAEDEQVEVQEVRFSAADYQRRR